MMLTTRINKNRKTINEKYIQEKKTSINKCGSIHTLIITSDIKTRKFTSFITFDVNMILLHWCVIFLPFWTSANAMDDFQSNKADSFASFLSKSWKHCRNVPTIILCFKQRSLLALDNLIKSNEAINFPGEIISLIKSKNSANFSKKFLSEEDLQKYLPKDIKVQDKTLNMLLESAYRKLLSSRALQIRFPYSTKEVTIDGKYYLILLHLNYLRYSYQ